MQNTIIANRQFLGGSQIRMTEAAGKIACRIVAENFDFATGHRCDVDIAIAVVDSDVGGIAERGGLNATDTTEGQGQRNEGKGMECMQP